MDLGSKSYHAYGHCGRVGEVDAYVPTRLPGNQYRKIPPCRIALSGIVYVTSNPDG